MKPIEDLEKQSNAIECNIIERDGLVFVDIDTRELVFACWQELIELISEKFSQNEQAELVQLRVPLDEILQSLLENIVGYTAPQHRSNIDTKLKDASVALLKEWIIRIEDEHEAAVFPFRDKP